MKISKKIIREILEIYELGKVKKIKLIEGGNINHNFVFTTNKGEYIVRFLGYKLDKYWEKQKELEFKVLNYLIDEKFPYDLPRFIKNKQGDYISNLDNYLIEVYPRLKGNNIIILNDKNIKEMAKALATYHKAMKNYKIPKDFNKLHNYEWISEELNDMKRIKPKNYLDKLMLDNINIFINALKLKNKIKIEGLLIVHSDFHKYNLLFNKEKLTGILDFENLTYGPRIRDLFFEKDNFSHSLLFINEYNKHNKLSKEEIDSLVKQKILRNCYSFRWAYRGTMKNTNKRVEMLKDTINKCKRYLEFDKVLKKEFKSS